MILVFNTTKKQMSRIVSSICMILITFFCVFMEGIWKDALFSFVITLALAEWGNLRLDNFIHFIGYACIMLFQYCIFSKPTLWTLFAIVWSTDIGAYIFGKFIGGPKIYVAISPQKTISGCTGGLLCGTLSGLCMGQGILKSAMVSFSTIVGDLLESYAKRLANVKDSNLNDTLVIPGHGGILDRIDGLIIAAPVAYYLNV